MFSIVPRAVTCVLADVAAVLGEAGIADPRREARWLVSAALDLPAERLIVEPGYVANGRQLERLAVWLTRRARHEPLWRIVGERSFYGRPFRLSPDTLEPRPDSEVVVEAALDLICRRFPGNRALRIADIGTGTGCLLISLLAELPHATGLGTDISPGALATARANAERLGVGDRSAWRRTRSLPGIDPPIDVLVSNPPYIRSAEIVGLEPAVRSFDPPAALDGGHDGLEVYREIAGGVARVVPDGIVVLEVGAGQHSDVAAMVGAAYEDHTTVETLMFHDLNGHVRCVAFSAHRLCRA